MQRIASGQRGSRPGARRRPPPPELRQPRSLNPSDMPNTEFPSADAAEAAFYAAFETTDLGLMARVWPQDQDARCVHPGSDLLQGYVAVMESWRSILAGAQRPTVRIRLIDRYDTDLLSVHLVEERIGPAGTEQDLIRVLATNIYVLTETGWRMSLHHASLPLVATAKDLGQPKQPPRVH